MPVETLLLPNGLRVLAHEDRTSPLVSLNMMYHVGSRHEQHGRTGLAHLLEHLLFEGSEHCPKGEFDLILERVGGTNNGSTWFDRTNYYETVPTHARELPFWLERERLAHFLPLLDAEMLELQRDVVMNERRQVYENRPYGMADERLYQLLFPPEHPYSWPTIGYMEDLERISLGDVREFYERFYTPGNAVLVVAGDIAAEQAFELADRYFGDLPAVPELPRWVDGVSNGSLADGTREVMEDRVSFPRVHRVYSVPPYGTQDWAALDVLAYLLADGESSRLQRALVRDGEQAQDVDTFLFPTELDGVLGIVTTARSGVEGPELEGALDRALADLVQNGVTEDEVEGAIRRVRRDQLAELSTVEDRADVLAYAATVLGGAADVERVLNQYVDVTRDDVVRVAGEHLIPHGGATLIVNPREEETDVAG